MKKPILCLDFDGVLHLYTTPWQGPEVIPDGMVDGADIFLDRAVESFTVVVYSSRSSDLYGIMAMKFWLKLQLYKRMEQKRADEILQVIEWPTTKPPAMITLDDRAIKFEGIWPSITSLLQFEPWNKKDFTPGQTIEENSQPGSNLELLVKLKKLLENNKEWDGRDFRFLGPRGPNQQEALRLIDEELKKVSE